MNWREAAQQHAMEAMPREACGMVVIVKGRERYWPAKNLAVGTDQFILDPHDYAAADDAGDIVAIVHSHPDLPCTPSQADLVSCEASGLPWHIVSVPHVQWHHMAPTGYQAPMVGREWSHGVLDCYSLIRDWYAQERGLQLPDFQRRDEWWLRGEDLYTELDVKSPAEAVRALCANFKDFAAFVSTSSERNVGYRVLNMREDVAVDELHNPASRRITIVPVVAGAGGKIGAILLGAALIGAAFLTGGASIAASGFFTGGIVTTFWGGVALSIGASLVLGGVSQLIAPQPKSAGPQEEQQPSYVFNGAVNTTAQGQPVPLGYGRMIVGSAVISAGISVEDIAV